MGGCGYAAPPLPVLKPPRAKRWAGGFSSNAGESGDTVKPYRDRRGYNPAKCQGAGVAVKERGFRKLRFHAGCIRPYMGDVSKQGLLSNVSARCRD
jgi:hypothetical protein